MKRLPLSPRLRLLCLVILAPIVYIFFASGSRRRQGPAFDPYDDALEDYRVQKSHVLDDSSTNGDPDGWSIGGVGIPNLDGLKGLGSTLGAGIGLGKENVLITGGAGQLGQALLPRLSTKYNIHILDIAPKPPHLPSSITYHRGSAANPRTIEGVLSSESFAGVIHFAGVSLNAWCAARELDCSNINEGSARSVVSAIAKQAQQAAAAWKKAPVPWLIMGSSVEVYGYSADANIDEESATVPNSSLGKTMLAAENTVKGAMRSRMKALILRFSDIYGYPPESTIEEGQIPTLVRNSLSSLTVQFDSDAEPQDMVYVDDAVEAVMGAVDYISHTSDSKIDIVNVVAGSRWAIEDIVERTRTITSSLSPFVDIGDHKSYFTKSQFSPSKASQLFSWSASTLLPAGLQKTISTYTQAQHAWTLRHITDQCPTSRLLPAGVSTKRHAADERNKALHKLDKCLVSLHFNHDGFLHHMKCEDGKTCHADGDYVSGYNWNATYWIAHANHAQERRARLSFEEEKGMGYLGIPNGLKEGDEVRWELVEDDEDDWTTAFDVEAATDSSMLTLSIPGSRPIHSISNHTDQTTWFAVSPKAGFDMRMTVVCCPREGEWPLLLDDFESSDMRFGATGQIPFNASRRSATCSRAEAAHDYTSSLLKRFDASSVAQEAESIVDDDAPQPQLDMKVAGYDRSLSLAPRLEAGALEMTRKPHNWTLSELPTCWNDCDSPLVCVSTGACRCVNAECPARRDNPLFTLRAAERRKLQVDADRREAAIQKSYDKSNAHLGDSILGIHAFEAVKDKHLLKVLVDDVAKLDIMDVLLPDARAYIMKHPDFIKVYVVDDTPGQAEIERHECHKLQDRHCFSADHILYEGMRSIQVKTPQEADLLVLPVYQQCKGVEFLIHDVMGNARDNITGVREVEKRVSAVLTHDWGICIQFAWEIWSARVKLFPDWVVDNTLIFSVMGDYDSPCYRPHQDVVIPARSCRSNLLRETFPTVDTIRPMRQRPNLMTWAGTYWGTGKNDRLRLTCPRGGANERELIQGMGPQDNWESWDYMNDLSNARFCPQPRGIAGWSPRTNDAIFAGCIPVLIAEGSHYPYADFLDWSKFAVRVQPTDLDRIEQILEAIPLEKVEEMQANLAMIRDGFIYATDEDPGEEARRKGPMWFALHEAGMRIRTRYPMIRDTKVSS